MKSIKVNFEFTEEDFIKNTSKAVCFVAIVRNDFNFTTKNFSKSKTTPSAEIFICPWWKNKPESQSKVKVKF